MGVQGADSLVKGRWPKARGDREGKYGHKVPILSSPPGGFLVSFWPSKKKLAADCARRRVSERNRPQGGS